MKTFEAKSYTDHFNKLTPAQLERLALCAEEMGESIQIIHKIIRHGYESCHPDNKTLTNRHLLEKELGHVRFSMIKLCEMGDLSKSEIHRHADLKKESVRPWLHHNY